MTFNHFLYTPNLIMESVYVYKTERLHTFWIWAQLYGIRINSPKQNGIQNSKIIDLEFMKACKAISRNIPFISLLILNWRKTSFPHWIRIRKPIPYRNGTELFVTWVFSYNVAKWRKSCWGKSFNTFSINIRDNP